MSQKPKQPSSREIKVKFQVDASSKEAIDKLKPENFNESVIKGSDKLRIKVSKKNR